MFDELSSKLNATLQRLAGRGVLTEDAVKEGLREIRRILLEADVSFDLTRDFLERVQARAVGVTALKEVRPGQQIVKIVYDELVALLGEKQAPIAHATVPPTIILLVGLQGSGKTTTAGKLAKRLKLEQKAPYLVAADVYRPAAIEQLQTLGKQIDVGVHADTASKDVVTIVRQGIVEAEAEHLPFPDESFDVVISNGVIDLIPDKEAVFRDLFRVLRRGGRLVVCEFSAITIAPADMLYRRYLLHVLPAIARRAARNPEAYEYLAESIVDWPAQRELTGLIKTAGWSAVRWRNLSLGAVAVHVARRA